MSIPTYKVALIGSGGCGKTAWIRRHITGQFTPQYVPTVGVEVHPITFETTEGKITLNFWDTAGQKKLSGLRDGYYIKADAAIFFFDIGSDDSYREVAWRHKEFERVAGSDRPVVLCGSKVDLQDDRRWVTPTIQKDLGCLYYPISSLSFYNYDKPVLDILRRLRNNPDLQFAEQAESNDRLRAKL